MFRRKARAESPTVPQGPWEFHDPLPAAASLAAEDSADRKVTPARKLRAMGAPEGPPYAIAERISGPALAAPQVISALESLLQPVSAEPLPLADAFSSLLAAEEGEAPAEPASGVDGDAVELLIERLSARVAERLESGGLLEQTQSVLHEVAERLMRDEIARINSRAVPR